jgi:hypothetical protein
VGPIIDFSEYLYEGQIGQSSLSQVAFSRGGLYVAKGRGVMFTFYAVDSPSFNCSAIDFTVSEASGRFDRLERTERTNDDPMP